MNLNDLRVVAIITGRDGTWTRKKVVGFRVPRDRRIYETMTALVECRPDLPSSFRRELEMKSQAPATSGEFCE